jgi:hypothetical protein
MATFVEVEGALLDPSAVTMLRKSQDLTEILVSGVPHRVKMGIADVAKLLGITPAAPAAAPAPAAK